LPRPRLRLRPMGMSICRDFRRSARMGCRSSSRGAAICGRCRRPSGPSRPDIRRGSLPRAGSVETAGAAPPLLSASSLAGIDRRPKPDRRPGRVFGKRGMMVRAEARSTPRWSDWLALPRDERWLRHGLSVLRASARTQIPAELAWTPRSAWHIGLARHGER